LSKLYLRKLVPIPEAPPNFAIAGALLLVAGPIQLVSPAATLWTTPCILLASLFIAWGAESAQFFVAQGFALAILAWLQTLPEFATEAVLSWHQERKLLLANLTGALRLLVGLAWPMIYATAAYSHRRAVGTPLRAIVVREHQSVEVVGLIVPLVYALFIWEKGNLNVYDAAVLTAIYVAYLFVLTKLPPEEHEGIDDLQRVPRTIAKSRRPIRIAAILGCFLAGGTLIYLTAEPFLGSLISLATVLGIPTFIVIQWLAPVVSEFPELASTFYFARQSEKAPMALMNIVSSNINQWTLLTAMLPLVLSLGAGQVSSIIFDAEQQSELLLTIAQGLVGLALLLKMRLAWWEALILFILYAAQLAFANTAAANPTMAYLTHHIHLWITYIYFIWAAASLLVLLAKQRVPPALQAFARTWRQNFTLFARR
jgi:cation:H+ antiporter